MEPLQAYISQARQQGQTDEQIRQALLSAGWQSAQVNAALPSLSGQSSPYNPQAYPGSDQPLVATVTSSVPDMGQPYASAINAAAQPVIELNQREHQQKRASSLRIAMACLAVLIIVIAASSFLLFRTNNSYQAIIQDFVSDMQHKDKAKADALESPAFKAEVQKYAGTTSFYAACQQEGELCTASFDASYLAKATKAYQKYTSSSGVKGEQLVYTVKQSLGSGSCSSKSTSTLSIAVIPSAKTWLVDNINDGVNATAQLCPVPGVK